MEQIIPILIAVALFAYQAYSNFKKEQEKAKKRNFGTPPKVQEDQQQEERRPNTIEEWFESLGDYDDTPYEEPKPVVIAETAATSAQQPAREEFNKFSGVLSDSEFERNRKKLKQTTNLRLKRAADMTPVYRSQIEEDEAFDFDLRDAVIKSVILDRPYK